MKPNTLYTLLACLAASLVAWLFYTTLISRAHHDLAEAIGSATPIADILASDPTSATLETRCRGSDPSQETALTEADVLLVAQLAGVLDAESDVRDLARPIRAAFVLDGDGSNVTACERGPDVLIRIAQGAGMAQQPSVSAEDIRHNTVPWVVYTLAGEPGVATAYSAAIADGDGDVPGRPEQPGGYWNPRRELPSVLENHRKALKRLFTQTRADAELARGGPDAFESREQVRALARAVALTIERDPDVQSARGSITLYQGPEQFSSLMCFAVALALCVSRWAWPMGSPPAASATDAEIADATSRARWGIRVLASAIPTLGFIGTVRGLYLALGKADQVVSSSSRMLQAMAISDLGSTLSVAFTTTLVALVLGLILSFIDAWSERAEVMAEIKRRPVPPPAVLPQPEPHSTHGKRSNDEEE